MSIRDSPFRVRIDQLHEVGIRAEVAAKRSICGAPMM